MRQSAVAAVVSLLMLSPAAGFAAGDHHEGQPAAKPRSDLDAFLFVYDDAAKKLRSLAEAVPEDKYGWRPSEGVRSVGEAFTHAGASIYLFASLAGAPLPEGAPKGFEETLALEKSASKKNVIELLDKSLAFGRELAVGAQPELLDKSIDFFGNAIDGKTLFLVLAAHLHEHLGQEIGYARSIGVTPPWSRRAAQSE